MVAPLARVVGWLSFWCLFGGLFCCVVLVAEGVGRRGRGFWDEIGSNIGNIGM